MFHDKKLGRAARIGRAATFFFKKLRWGWARIADKGHAVGLSPAQRPVAMLVALAYFLAAFAGQLTSAVSRSFDQVPASAPLASS
jgi:hypothetical protein